MSDQLTLSPQPNPQPVVDSTPSPEPETNPRPVVDPLQDAIAWTRQNPEAYRALIQWSLDDMAAGIRPSMDAYGHVLRRPHMAARLGLRRSGPNLLFNDHLTSSLARLLKREHGIPFATRQARVDSWRTS